MIPSAPLGTDAAADRFDPAGATGLRPGVALRRFRFELAAHPQSVARARQLTRARLTGWSVGEDACDTATLIVSELVTNAIVHTAGASVVCELQDEGGMVRIAVRDEGCAPDEPHPVPQRCAEEHGRGLLLVEALSLAWGTQKAGAGLLVWAELARATDQRTADQRTTGQRTTDQRATGQPNTDQRATDRRTTGQPNTDQRATDRRTIDQRATGECSIPAQPSRDLSCSGDRSRAIEAAPARYDLGWSAKKPPADGQGSRTDASWTGTEWV
ncbi:ATP-binding protein [Streptomyces sp. RY43-2]|uniref:ATP-binding protein n=1 Tax=Streptomyces macrolidinus TaxID=2952607 RepID=A0ABT0Z8B8_9ACTN|nr:ATP-binding protein [Streptomyces macrolidinus]MCN9239697.1 ATP-binding protein [Streptomyces macrolidinus]